MDTGQHCAYNQTKKCFLSLDVLAGDFSTKGLEDWFPKLAPNSGAGLWIVPFRGMPATNVRTPLDLLYLNEDSRVIAVVESYPTFRVSSSSAPAASVLALPARSLASTKTQPGDELMLCAAEEMKWLLERLSNAGVGVGVEPSAVQTPIFSNEQPPAQPPASPDAAPPQAEVPPAVQRSGFHETPETVTLNPERKSAKPPRNWLERWLFPDHLDEDQDQRIVPREPAPGLAAHFWTGGAPQVHTIRNISPTGLYVVTTERWYPGTQMRITLTKTDGAEKAAERSITVEAIIVRWGNDGVGLEFLVQDPRNVRRAQPLPFEGASREKLEQFLKRLKERKS